MTKNKTFETNKKAPNNYNNPTSSEIVSVDTVLTFRKFAENSSKKYVASLQCQLTKYIIA